MPKLLIFAPCQHVLHDDDKDASIIAIVEGLKLRLPPNSPEPPSSTVIPWNWCVYVKWALEPHDLGRKFQQRILFKSPVGQLLMETTPQIFYFESSVKGRMVNVVTKFLNFPFSPGMCALSIEYRELGQEHWNEIASFLLSIELERATERPEDRPKTVIWHTQNGEQMKT